MHRHCLGSQAKSKHLNSTEIMDRMLHEAPWEAVTHQKRLNHDLMGVLTINALLNASSCAAAWYANQELATASGLGKADNNQQSPPQSLLYKLRGHPRS